MLTINDIQKHLLLQNVSHELVVLVDTLVTCDIVSIHEEFRTVMKRHKDVLEKLGKLFHTTDQNTIERYMIDLYNLEIVRDEYMKDISLNWAFIQSDDEDGSTDDHHVGSGDIVTYDFYNSHGDRTHLRLSESVDISHDNTSTHISSEYTQCKHQGSNAIVWNMLSASTFVIGLLNTCLIMYLIKKQKSRHIRYH